MAVWIESNYQEFRKTEGSRSRDSTRIYPFTNSASTLELRISPSATSSYTNTSFKCNSYVCMRFQTWIDSFGISLKFLELRPVANGVLLPCRTQPLRPHESGYFETAHFFYRDRPSIYTKRVNLLTETAFVWTRLQLIDFCTAVTRRLKPSRATAVYSMASFAELHRIIERFSYDLEKWFR